MSKEDNKNQNTTVNQSAFILNYQSIIGRQNNYGMSGTNSHVRADKDFEFVNLVFFDTKLFGTYERQLALRKVLKEAFKRMMLGTGRDLVAVFIAYHFLIDKLVNLTDYTNFIQDVDELMPGNLTNIKADETNRSKKYKSYAESLSEECKKWFIDDGYLPDKTVWKSLEYKYHVDDDRRRQIQSLVTTIYQGMKDIIK